MTISAPLRILFLGYSEVGHECLSLLLERGDNVVALITHEDNPGEKIWFKTPAAIAREHKPAIPICTPESINTPEWIARIRDEIRPDLILSVYYRNMVSTRVLEIPRLGAFNMHGSLLPKYRGRAPINWAVLHGEPRIGMTLHKMVRRADAGDIVDQQGVDIGPRDTAEQAFRKVLPCARAVLARQIDALLAGTAPATPQDESQATYFGGRKSEDGRISFAKTSTEIFNLIRAVTDPYPGAFADVNNARLMIWWAETGSPAVREALLNDSRAHRHIAPITPIAPITSIAATAPPIPRRPVPGEILSLTPLVVATADGALELTRTEWRGAPAESLRIGQILS
jgi:methionyl-tRNA formyltransferase